MAQLFTPEPFSHLSGALAAMEAVVENFWSTLHPTLPEKKRKGDTEQEQAVEIIEHRIKPLLQLVGDTAESGLLYMPLQMLPLVGDIDFGRFYKAEKDGSLSNLKDEAVIAYGHEKAEVEARIRALGSSLDTLVRLEASLADKCRDAGATPISFKFVKDAIERLISSLKFLIGEQFSHWPLDPEPAVQAVPEVSPNQVEHSEPLVQPSVSEPTVAAVSAAQTLSNVVTLPTGGVATREQALANLQAIADYFLEHEPHSPIYLLLKRAIRWGGMSLPELLEELVGDNSAVHQRIEHLAGLESADHTAALPKVAVEQAVTSLDSVQDEVKLQETTTPNVHSADSGLSNIEW
ncbi:uncharacterized protein ImpA [Vibrio ponticus]|nr:uncharacterized protein ImpA [Vibrio ponticus]